MGASCEASICFDELRSYQLEQIAGGYPDAQRYSFDVSKLTCRPNTLLSKTATSETGIFLISQS
jgi:hypothetical protein